MVRSSSSSSSGMGCSVAFQSCLGFPAAVPFAAVALIPGGGAHISKLSLPFSGLV